MVNMAPSKMVSGFLLALPLVLASLSHWASCSTSSHGSSPGPYHTEPDASSHLQVPLSQDQWPPPDLPQHQEDRHLRFLNDTISSINAASYKNGKISMKKVTKKKSLYKKKNIIQKKKITSIQKNKVPKAKVPYKMSYPIKKKPYKTSITKKAKMVVNRYRPRFYLPKSKNNLNHIDTCWRNDPYWAQNRMHLADCAIGYGYNALGGKGGQIYIVTDPSDDPINPKPGTLRYGVIQEKPLWIIFVRDMLITLKNELIMTSYKTLDGRGSRVQIAFGPCITIQFVSHIIIHGLNIHNCKPGSSGMVRSSTSHVGHRQGSDGDAISMFGATNIWIDHNYFAECTDGLVDAIHASTMITISNNLFTDHDKVMLLGHSDSYSEDKAMRVTVVYNHFGPGLVQRLPRCRFGYFHIANNRYTQWIMYAIGASANPTIKSEGNYFVAPNDKRFKAVVKLEGARKTSSSNWKSVGDMFLNGAYFGQIGTSTYVPNYSAKGENFPIQPASLVPYLTADAGPLNCRPQYVC